jgi:hypothetical protein
MQLEKAKKALEIIRDFPCIINRTGETHSMKHIAASTLKELENNSKLPLDKNKV